MGTKAWCQGLDNHRSCTSQNKYMFCAENSNLDHDYVLYREVCLAFGMVEQRLHSPMAWEIIWAKGTTYKGAAVAGILITPPALQSLEGCVCLLHTSSSILKLLSALKAVSHFPYN